jgi:hypothetical protein
MTLLGPILRHGTTELAQAYWGNFQGARSSYSADTSRLIRELVARVNCQRMLRGIREMMIRRGPYIDGVKVEFHTKNLIVIQLPMQKITVALEFLFRV